MPETEALPEQKGLRGQDLCAKIAAEPKWFSKSVFNLDVWPKQEEIVASIFKHKRTAVRGCVSSSKTMAAAIAIYAWLLAHPQNSRVFHLAPSFRQVQTNAFGYLKKLDRMATENGYPLGAKIFSEPRIELGDGWVYTGFNTKEPAALHGIHGPNDLIILDDAHGISKEIFDELENTFAGGNTRCLMLFNPVILSGETYDCSGKNKALWNNIVIGFSDLQKAYEAGYKMDGTLQQKTVDTWASKYGAKSNFYRSKVLGEYPDQAADSLIPLDWIELAIAREVPLGGKKVAGCDVAWTGADESVICILEGRKVHALEKYANADPMTMADHLDVHLAADHVMEAHIDSIGLGAGVFSREQQRGRNVHAFIASESAVGQWEQKEASDHFLNIRAQAAWTLRNALDPKNPEAISLPKDDDLVAQLSAITYKINQSGKIALMPKDDMRKALGYSPDSFDALCMAVWGAVGGGSIPWSAWV